MKRSSQQYKIDEPVRKEAVRLLRQTAMSTMQLSEGLLTAADMLEIGADLNSLALLETWLQVANAASRNVVKVLENPHDKGTATNPRIQSVGVGVTSSGFGGGSSDSRKFSSRG